MQAQVLGLSVDSTDCLRAWAESLGGITYPLLSDFYPHGQVSQLYDVLRKEGYAERAIVIIDKQGIVRYVDVHDIGEQPDTDEIFKVLNELEPEAAAALAVADRAAAAAVERPIADVIMYCTPWCGDCRQARAWLKERGISYAEINIAQDREAAKRVRGWASGFETTPTFDIKGQIIVDWQQAEVARALGIE